VTLLCCNPHRLKRYLKKDPKGNYFYLLRCVQLWSLPLEDDLNKVDQLLPGPLGDEAGRTDCGEEQTQADAKADEYE
jgi:hypothetical protein